MSIFTIVFLVAYSISVLTTFAYFIPELIDDYKNDKRKQALGELHRNLTVRQFLAYLFVPFIPGVGLFFLVDFITETLPKAVTNFLNKPLIK